MKITFVIIIILGLLFSCSPEQSELENYLLAHPWYGMNIDMDGLYAETQDRLGYIPKLTFEPGGLSTLSMGDDSYECKWKIDKEEKEIIIRGPGIDSRVFIEKSISEGIYSFCFHDLHNYTIYFYREDYLAENSKKLQASREEDENKKEEASRELGSLREEISLIYDISTMDDGFLTSLLKDDFRDFEVLDLTDENREKLLDRYFSDLLKLGLARESWTKAYYDIDPILDGYEDYVLNASLSLEERQARDGEEVFIHREQVLEFVEPRIELFRIGFKRVNRGAHYENVYFDEGLEEISQDTNRYHGDGDYLMEIKKADPPIAHAYLLTVWRKDNQLVIQVAFGKDQEEGFGWYMLEEVPGEDFYKYIMGSYNSYE